MNTEKIVKRTREEFSENFVPVLRVKKKLHSVLVYIYMTYHFSTVKAYMSL
jgi:hypothetical protein